MGGLFAQVGLGIDVVGVLAFEVSIMVWVVGLIPGLIGWAVAGRHGSRSRAVSLSLAFPIMGSAAALWIICVWGSIEWGLGSGVGQFLLAFALCNTCLAVRIMYPPARARRKSARPAGRLRGE